jgi:hypothetical protein
MKNKVLLKLGLFFWIISIVLALVLEKNNKNNLFTVFLFDISGVVIILYYIINYFFKDFFNDEFDK